MSLHLLSEKWRRKRLSLQEQFSLSIRHTRLIGHRIGIYAFQNHTWEEQGDRFVAVGELEQLLEIDLGQELVKMAGHPFDTEIVKKNVLVPKSDGSYVLGVQMRDVLRKTEAVKAAESYLKIQFNFDGYADYHFKLLREPVSLALLLEFQVVTYFSVDEKLVEEKKVLYGQGLRKSSAIMFLQVILVFALLRVNAGQFLLSLSSLLPSRPHSGKQTTSSEESTHNTST